MFLNTQFHKSFCFCLSQKKRKKRFGMDFKHTPNRLHCTCKEINLLFFVCLACFFACLVYILSVFFFHLRLLFSYVFFYVESYFFFVSSAFPAFRRKKNTQKRRIKEDVSFIPTICVCVCGFVCFSLQIVLFFVEL